MMAARFRIHAGVSDPLIFVCEELETGASAFAAVNLAGAGSPRVHLKNQTSGCVYQFSGCVVISSASTGQVTLSQSACDLPPGNYSGYIRLTDGAGYIVDFPSNDFFTLEVGQVF
jgi:hypothetical protein